MLGSVLDNAAAPERRHRRYEGLATVSGGYDSNALAAVSSRLSVREAITLCDQSSGRDSGEAVARHLGMSVGVYGLAEFRTTPDVDEADLAGNPVSGVSFAPCEPQLVGRILIMGQWGDKLFGLEPPANRDFRGSPTGAGRMVEFRLRAGFLNFHPLYAGGLALAAMRAISSSPEMAPRRVGGDYDRPIARRILEESGVPARDLRLKKPVFRVSVGPRQT